MKIQEKLNFQKHINILLKSDSTQTFNFPYTQGVEHTMVAIL